MVIVLHKETFNELLQSKGYSTLIAKPGDTFVPGILPQKFSLVRNKIISIINSIEDLDTIDKDLLLQQIRDAIKDI